MTDPGPVTAFESVRSRGGGIEALIGQREEGASCWRGGGLVPGQSSTPPQPWPGDLEHRNTVSLRRRTGKDGDAEPHGGELDERGELSGFRGDPGGEAGVAAGVLEHRSQSAAAHEGDHGLLAELGERDRATPAESIARADREDERLGRDNAAADPGRHGLCADSDDRRVDVAAGHSLEQWLVLPLGERNLDRRMGAMEVTEGFGETMIDGPRHAHLQSSVQYTAQGVDGGPAPFGGGEGRPRIREEGLASDGESHRPLITMEERLPQLAFETTDLRADSRLRNRHAGCGSGELPLLRDRHEVLKLP
jgi:hypothetical protein